MATRTAKAVFKTGLSVLFAGALAVGFSSSAALASGDRRVSSATTTTTAAADGPVVLAPDDDGPYELVMDENEDDSDDGFEADEATNEEADAGATVIGNGVQRSGRSAGRGGRTVSAPRNASGRAKAAPAKTGPEPVTAAPDPGPGLEGSPTAGPTPGIDPGDSAASPGAPAAGVLGTSLDRPVSHALPPVDLFATPAGHASGEAAGASLPSDGDWNQLGMVLTAALLVIASIGALGAEGAVIHRSGSFGDS